MNEMQLAFESFMREVVYKSNPEPFDEATLVHLKIFFFAGAMSAVMDDDCGNEAGRKRLHEQCNSLVLRLIESVQKHEGV